MATGTVSGREATEQREGRVKARKSTFLGEINDVWSSFRTGISALLLKYEASSVVVLNICQLEMFRLPGGYTGKDVFNVHLLGRYEGYLLCILATKEGIK